MIDLPRPGDMKWYGILGGKSIYQSPTGRLYHVVKTGSDNDDQKTAFEAWARDGFK